MTCAVTMLSPEEAYRCWAATYDSTDNPLIALEERCLLPLLNDLQGLDVLDAGCGTGRWLRHMNALGICSLRGVDSSREMLTVARQTCSPSVRLYLSNVLSLPLPDASVDLVIASFLVSYVKPLDTFIQEVHRVLRDGGVLLLSDLHPDARRRGWQSTFRWQDSTYAIETYPYSLNELRKSLRKAGFRTGFFLEPCMGEAERSIFIQAGREDLFAAATEHPAIYASRFVKGTSDIPSR